MISEKKLKAETLEKQNADTALISIKNTPQTTLIWGKQE